jgi:hypothetical protein
MIGSDKGGLMPYIVFIKKKGRTWQLTEWDGDDVLTLDPREFPGATAITIEPTFLEEDE